MRKFILLFILFFISCLNLANAETAEVQFQSGLASFQSKQYEEAAKSFQAVLDSGLVSAEVLHNLALSNYQLGKKALALAQWRKALVLSPGHRAARSGLTYAEKSLGLGGFERDPVSRLLRQTVDTFSIFDVLWLLALALGVTGWLWLKFFIARRRALEEELPLPSTPSAAIILTVLVLGCAGLTTLKISYSSLTRATVIAPNANALSLPTEGSVGLFELKGGVEVLVRRHNSNWYQVQNSDGASGWVKDADLFITSTAN